MTGTLPALDTFGERLAFARKRSGVTLTDLVDSVNKGAPRSPVNVLQIRNAEVGLKAEPIGAEAVSKIATKLGVEPSWLLNGRVTNETVPAVPTAVSRTARVLPSNGSLHTNDTKESGWVPPEHHRHLRPHTPGEGMKPTESGSIGERIRLARLAKGLSQEILAGKIRRSGEKHPNGIDLSQLELNRHLPRVTTEMRRALFEFLGIDADPTAPSSKSTTGPRYGRPHKPHKPHVFSGDGLVLSVNKIEIEADETEFRLHIQHGKATTQLSLSPRLAKALLETLVDDVAAYEAALGKIG